MRTDVASTPRTGWIRWRERLWLAAMLCGCVFLCLLLISWVDPPDSIPVRIVGVPDDVDFACIAFEDSEKIELVEWYPSPLPPGPDDAVNRYPPTSYWSNIVAQPYQGKPVEYPVQWRNGDRYGVVTRTRGGGFSVRWFDRSVDPNYLACKYLAIKWAVTFDLSESEPEPLDQPTIKRLGLDKSYQPKPT